MHQKRGLNVGYHMNHSLNGEVMFNPQTGVIADGIGNYNCIKFDEDKKEAVIFCDNPYPSKFDEGILTQLLRMFKPKGSTGSRVTLDTSKETRDNNGKSCTFIVSW